MGCGRGKRLQLRGPCGRCTPRLASCTMEASSWRPEGQGSSASPAAVTGPDFPAQPRHDENSIRQASKPTQDPLHSHSSPAGQKSPGESQTKTLKPEPPTHLKKKPQLPPKPAHLSQLPLPRWLSKSSALAHSAAEEAGPGKYKQGETATANHDPRPNKVSTATGQGRVPLPQGPAGQSQPSPQHGPSTVVPGPTKSQATGSNHHSPDPLGLSALSSHPISLQQGPSLPGEKCTDASQQGAPESSEILQGGQQELQGLLSQVQALEKEAESTVDVRALRRLFEAVPQLPGAPPAPATPRKPEASVEQAFGELTRVSTEVARLKEQTLARLLDIEEAVHKALSSMSSLQPGSNTRGHSQGPPREHSAHEVSVTDSGRVRPNCSGQEVQSQTLVKSQTEVTSHPEVQSQTKVRNHSEARSQAALATPPTRRLETLREDSRLPQGLPLSRESLSSPTVISMESATRKFPEAASPRGNPEISVKRVHFTQDECQTQPHQKNIWHEAGEKEAPQLSGPPLPGPAAASARPTRQKTALELQTAPGASQHYGATGTVAERVDWSGTTALTSPTTVTEPAEPPRGPGPHLGCHTSPLMRQFLHSPAGLSMGLAEAEMLHVPCGHPTPAAQ
ncbi:xin actin-binding repeat-containing protein 1 isoform X3 [Muntiacus reevesi]|uniref:xin actin-binding repeat-containing protein 1 isoform X3 n=1 Tax=Muntiacus reevesi TaxID=9886 RepID=UPI003306D594